MLTQLIRLRIYAALVAVMLSACGGGIDGTGSGGGGGGGTTGDVAVGTVSASSATTVNVNGVTFDDSTASITVNGVNSSSSDVLPGMVARVEGDISSSTNGTATAVVVEEVLKGSVQVIIDSAHIQVLAQSVEIGQNTIVEGVLSAGSLVSVYGHIKAPGVVSATRIEVKTSLLEYKVIGHIASVAGSSLVLGSATGLNVNFGSADITNMPGNQITSANVGELVEVKSSTDAVANTLTATKIEPQVDVPAGAVYVELEGHVTELAGVGYDFIVGQTPVLVSGSTRFEGGVPSDIDLGTKLEVEGQMVSGTLNAEKVIFKDSIRVEGDITDFNLVAGTFKIDGFLSFSVSVDSITEIRSSGTDVLGDFANGTHIRMRGYLTGGNVVAATRLEERSSSPDVIVQGPVSSFSDPNMVIMGESITVPASGAVFRDVTDATISRVSFTAALTQPQVLVKVKGTVSMGAFSGDEFELESD